MRRFKCFSLICILLVVSAVSCLVGISGHAKAANISIQVEPVTSWQSTYTYGTTNPYTNCPVSRSGYDAYVTNSGSSPCAINWSFQGFDGLVFNNKYVFEIDTFLYEYRDREPLNTYLNQNANMVFRKISDSAIVYYPNFLGYDVTNISESSALLRTYFTIPVSSTGNLTGLKLEWTNYPFALQQNETALASARIPVYQITNQNIQNIINVDNEGVINAINSMNSGNIYAILESVNQIKGLINSNSESQQQQQQQDQEDRNNLESQKEQTSGEASNNGSNASSTGTSLFGAFTQLLGALTNINGNSCKLPNIQVYSLELGSMDLCTYNIPPQIMALVSIGMVFIIIPLGIHLVKKMIALYKEITG